MKSAFHYVLKTKLIESGSDGKPVFTENETVFENVNPINARIESFNSFQNYVDVLLEELGSQYTSDKQARSELKFHKSFVSLGICIIQETEEEDIQRLSENNEICIYSIGPIGVFNLEMEDEPDGDESYLDSLCHEYKLYKYFKYETGDHEVVIPFYEDGGDYDDSETFDFVKVLKTPFDWDEHSGQKRLKYKALESLDEAEDVRAIAEKTLEYSEEWFNEQIAKGESDTTEFKPSLVYNYLTQTGGMGIKAIIAKAICAFLNTRGGILFIGVKDNGEIQGLESDFSLSSSDKKPLDFFRLEFDQMVTHFFGRSIYSNIIPKMLTIGEKHVFVVSVWPYKKPVFIKGRDSNGKERMEFYIRGAASTLPLHETPEKLVEYCLNKWGTKD